MPRNFWLRCNETIKLSFHSCKNERPKVDNRHCLRISKAGRIASKVTAAAFQPGGENRQTCFAETADK